MNLLDWLANGANWIGSSGIWVQLGVHSVYSLLAIGVALVLAAPFGIWVGVTGRGETFVVGVANTLRALPTLGLLILLVFIISPLISSTLAYTIPLMIVLVLLAVPPILVGISSGIQQVDRDAVAAARGMGYRTGQIVGRIQLPCALPLILSGIRGAMLQVVSTATIAGYTGAGGLGKFIIEGRASGIYPEMAAGAILVGLLALVWEVALLLLAHVTVSPGIRRAHRTLA